MEPEVEPEVAGGCVVEPDEDPSLSLEENLREKMANNGVQARRCASQMGDKVRKKGKKKKGRQGTKKDKENERQKKRKKYKERKTRKERQTNWMKERQTNRKKER